MLSMIVMVVILIILASTISKWKIFMLITLTIYIFQKCNNETYQASIFREFDELDIKIIHNRDNNITIIV